MQTNLGCKATSAQIVYCISLSKNFGNTQMPLQEMGDMKGSNMRQICGILVIQKHQANRRHLQQVYFTVMEKNQNQK